MAEEQYMDGGMDDGPAPDKTLAELYKSARPPVELVPGVGLSTVINSVWLPSEAKAMLAESWIPVISEPEDGEDAPPPPPAFDPTSLEYSLMQKRLSKSVPLLQFNELTIRIKELEVQLEKLEKERNKDEKAIEETGTGLETAKATLLEVDAQLAELRASFTEEPISLVPWMTTLFDLADAGLTTFDVSGSFFPHTNLRSLFSSDNSSSFYGGPEAVLGAFKKRYEKERGPDKIQLLFKLVPNMFQDGYTGPAFVESVVERVRQAVYGPESTDALDLVQLYWWDFKEGDFLPTLKAMQALTEDKLDINEETAEVAIAEPKKAKAIGLIDFPHRAIIQAVQAGVPLVSLSIPFSLADRRHQEALEVAREYNIKVFARDGLLGGLISEKYLGSLPPSTTGPQDPDVDDIASALDLVNNYGGWDKVQGLLKQVKKVADKHGVRMQTVALRWQIDLGLFPTATTRWAKQSWSQFGYYYWGGPTPGLDWQLFQVESFLDEEDMRALHKLGS